MNKHELHTKSYLVYRGKAVRLDFGETGLRLEHFLNKNEWYIHFSPGGNLNTAISMSEKARRSNLLCRGLLYFWDYGRTSEGKGVLTDARSTIIQETNLENALAFLGIFERKSAFNIVTVRQLETDLSRIQQRAAMTFNIKSFIELSEEEKIIEYLRVINDRRKF